MRLFIHLILLLSLGCLLYACEGGQRDSKGVDQPVKEQIPTTTDGKNEDRPPPNEMTPPHETTLPEKPHEIGDKPKTEQDELVNGSGSGTADNKPKPGTGTSGKEQGELLYAIPDSMQVEQVKRVEVRVIRGLAEDNIAQLTDRLEDTSRVVINVIETSGTMKIQLREQDPTNPKFSIDPLTSEEQIIDKGGIGNWSWNVKPLVVGQHKLIITAGIKKRSEETGETGYRYAPVWDEYIAVAAIEAAPNWLAIGGGASLLLALLVAVGLWRSKSQQLLSPPLIQREKLDHVEDLIKADQLEAALDEMEGLVQTVRDKEHNLIIGYKAELNSFTNRYNSGEISYEELSKVKARIRRAIVEMNDRLGGDPTEG
ncbi:MAG: hypothetical protein AAGG75_16975 [Bacteroidota bacterium]